MLWVAWAVVPLETTDPLLGTAGRWRQLWVNGLSWRAWKAGEDNSLLRRPKALKFSPKLGHLGFSFQKSISAWCFSSRETLHQENLLQGNENVQMHNVLVPLSWSGFHNFINWENSADQCYCGTKSVAIFLYNFWLFLVSEQGSEICCPHVSNSWIGHTSLQPLMSRPLVTSSALFLAM